MTTPTITDLDDATAVAWFKREVAVPGTFATLFPETTDPLISAALADGLYRAKLDGWFPGLDVDFSSHLLTVPVSPTALAVIILYAATTFMQNEIKNMPTRQSYKAGNVETTTEHSAGVLKERLAELADQKKQLIANARSARGGTPVYMSDGYAIRVSALYGYEIPVFVGNAPAELTRY